MASIIEGLSGELKNTQQALSMAGQAIDENHMLKTILTNPVVLQQYANMQKNAYIPKAATLGGIGRAQAQYGQINKPDGLSGIGV